MKIIHAFPLHRATRGPWTAWPSLIKVVHEMGKINQHFHRQKIIKSWCNFKGKCNVCAQSLTFLAQEAFFFLLFTPWYKQNRLTRLTPYSLHKVSSFYTRYLLFKYEWLVRELLAVNPQLSASMVSKNYMHKNFITNSKLNNSVYFWTIPLFRQNRLPVNENR